MRHNIRPKAINAGRSAGSNCCLCKVNKATKENSHIVPKFMTKSILGSGSQKRAFLINSGKTYKAPSISQDTAKEDFILCESCERYFSVLETYLSTRLHNRIHHVKFANQFTTLENDGGITYKICNEIDSRIFRLFLYSIIWRCSVSSEEAYIDFSLESDEEETLQKALLSSKCESQADLLNSIDETAEEMATIPFVFFTAESFSDPTGNVVAANPFAKNPYQLILNEYMLIFSFNNNNNQMLFEFLNNTDNQPIKVGFFSTDLWVSLRQRFLRKAVENSMGHLSREGRTPWFMNNPDVQE